MKLERTLTASEICKIQNRGYDCPYCETKDFPFSLQEEYDEWACWACGWEIKILSPGDTFPTGRCECGHRKDFHNLLHPCMVKGCKCPLFKPSLGKVVGIERINPCCKICGKPPHEYMGMHNYETVGEVKWKITLEVD